MSTIWRLIFTGHPSYSDSIQQQLEPLDNGHIGISHFVGCSLLWGKMYCSYERGHGNISIWKCPLFGVSSTCQRVCIVPTLHWSFPLAIYTYLLLLALSNNLTQPQLSNWWPTSTTELFTSHAKYKNNSCHGSYTIRTNWKRLHRFHWLYAFRNTFASLVSLVL